MRHKWAWLIATVLIFCSCDQNDENPVNVNQDECPNNPNKIHPGVCGCDKDDVIDAMTGIYTCLSTDMDLCPNDPYKDKPGICGCGVADTIGSDGVALCLTQNFDLCPEDPNKTLPGICGCGIADTIDITTGVASCLAEKLDLCPDDDNKTLPGVCGCGIADTPDEATGIPLCTVEELDFCPQDPEKTKPGACGCGVPDVDSDGDGKLDCEETCIYNSEKFEPGVCGCDIPDTKQNVGDSDKDKRVNCLDFCPDNYWKQDDDGCGCDDLYYELQGGSSCARILSNAQDFISFRDNWNQGNFEGQTNDMAFILVDDINLGSVLTQDGASHWVGVGTEDRPFNAIFFGNNHKIEAVRQTGSIRQTLIFGEGTASNVALFAHANQARFYDLKLELTMTGNDHVAGLAAEMSGSSAENISMNGEVSGGSCLGGIVASANNDSMSKVYFSGKVTGTGEYIGGIAGNMLDTQISVARSTAEIHGGQYVGGIAGSVAKSSRLISVHADGSLWGGSYTGAIAGELTSRSSLLNAYTTGVVTCTNAPCALLIAQISDFSTVKNSYTSGVLFDEIPQGGDDDKPEDPEDPENPEEPENPALSVPVAALVASFGSEDSVVETVYYWGEIGVPAIPGAAVDMSLVEEPLSFEYNELRPYTEVTANSASILLLDKLNSALSCNIGICTLDSYPCIRWTSEMTSIRLPGESGDTMSVYLPVLAGGD